MKKIIAMLLVAVMGMSLVACGNSEELEKYKKYETLINYLEEDDFESAYAELLKLYEAKDNAAVEEGTAKEVEITTENWQEYFEIVEREQADKNEFDEVEDMYKTYYLVLKEGYTMSGHDTDIAVEYDYVAEWRYVEVDTEAETLTIGDLVGDRENEDMKGNMTTVYSEETDLITSRSWSDGMQAVPTKPEIVRIQGKLFVTE